MARILAQRSLPEETKFLKYVLAYLNGLLLHSSFNKKGVVMASILDLIYRLVDDVSINAMTMWEFVATQDICDLRKNIFTSERRFLHTEERFFTPEGITRVPFPSISLWTRVLPFVHVIVTGIWPFSKFTSEMDRNVRFDGCAGKWRSLRRTTLLGTYISIICFRSDC